MSSLRRAHRSKNRNNWDILIVRRIGRRAITAAMAASV